MKRNNALRFIAALLGATWLGMTAGCGQDQDRVARDRYEQDQKTAPASATAAAEMPPGAAVAVAHLHSTQGNNVSGMIRFVQEATGVRVAGTVTGLSPGEHGFHVHEHGDCSAPDASSAGGHYNPSNNPHADRTAPERHMGDLGNLSADANGRAAVNFLDLQLELTGEHSIVGRAVVIHAGADDLSSQPSGDSGARVACGVIAWVKPE